MTDLPYHSNPLPLLQALRPLGHAVLLHSADRAHPQARFDVIAAAPDAWVECHNDRTSLTAADGSCQNWNEPFAALQQLLSGLPSQPPDYGPFTGGIIGLAGYDLARTLEPFSDRAPAAEGSFPDLVAGRYLWAVVTDHQRRATRVIEALPGALPEAVRAQLQALAPEATEGHRSTPPLPRLQCETSREQYQHAFDRVQHYLHAGDCYQVNLSVRFSAPCREDPLSLYARLSARHPAPFSGFLECPHGAVLSFSPERFIRVSDGTIETCPIKGTRRRGATSEADATLRQALVDSAKDRAENLMIVDLLRNDLGRSCEPGSIRVPDFCRVESFGSVHHLVSRVCGKLSPGITALESLRRAFPGGSITGAPKHRAMQIIDELEPHHRGPYCGSLFMADGAGNLDSSITIRTLLLHRERLYCWGGGGLVADSEADAEWDEIHAKVGALIGKQE